MTLTAEAKDEIVQTPTSPTPVRLAEVAAMLRFAGFLEVQGDSLTLQAEFDHRGSALRLKTALEELFDAHVELISTPAGARRGPRHEISVHRGVEEIARRTGLVTRAGHMVLGLPTQVISGTVAVTEAAWRGAFLAAGVIAEPGRASALEVRCPCPEAALALVGLTRRLGWVARTRESRGVDRVHVRDGEAVGALLTRMGAQRTRLRWDEQRRRREAQTAGNRLANFDDANLRRSARAAIAASARVERAMTILGDDVPEHLAEAGQLRVTHQEASLEELGRLADPPMTKDAIAGRIRRLLSMADKKAKNDGIPDTQSVVLDEE